MIVRAYEWKVEKTTTPKVVPQATCQGGSKHWQMVQTVTRLGDSIKQFGILRVSSDLQCS